MRTTGGTTLFCAESSVAEKGRLGGRHTFPGLLQESAEEIMVNSVVEQ